MAPSWRGGGGKLEEADSHRTNVGECVSLSAPLGVELVRQDKSLASFTELHPRGPGPPPRSETPMRSLERERTLEPRRRALQTHLLLH